MSSQLECVLSCASLWWLRRIFDFKDRCVSTCQFIMPKYHLFLAGSIQKSWTIKWHFTGKTMFFYEFFSDFTCPEFSNWTTSTVVQILAKGDWLYLWMSCPWIICRLLLSPYITFIKQSLLLLPLFLLGSNYQNKILDPLWISYIYNKYDVLFCFVLFLLSNAKNS